MNTKTIQTTVTLGAAETTGDNQVPVPGGVAKLLAFAIDYVGQPGTCDVTITAEEPGGASKALVTITSANTDLNYERIVEKARNGTNAEINTEYRSPIVAGAIKVAVAQGAEGTVKCRFVVEV